MKAYQHPVQMFNPAGPAESRSGPYRVWMRLLLRSAAAGTHVLCQNTLLLQNEKSLVPKLPRMVLKYLWSTSGFCYRNHKALYKYSVHTVHVILAGIFGFFPFLFFVSKITLLGGAYRWYPKASFVCTVHYIFISGSFPIAATLAFVFSPKISLVFPF